MAKYAHPEVLVTTDWVNENLDKPGIKLVELDVDTKAYEAGHIPGAVGWNWQTQTQDVVRRDIINQRSSKSCSATRASCRPIRSCSTATTTTGSPRMAFGSARSMVT